MASTSPDPKQHYKQLRKLSLSRLWEEEVPRFQAARGEQRADLVAIIRAVGAGFSEQGTTQQKAQARQWLRSLLEDKNEKVRRYAIQALPKLGGGTMDESDLLDLLHNTQSATERKHLTDTLSKIGSHATLEALDQVDASRTQAVEQRVKATIARRQSPSTLPLTARLKECTDLHLHLRTRRGLESILLEELTANPTLQGRLSVVKSKAGLLVAKIEKSVSLLELHELRCFSELGFLLGSVKHTSSVTEVADLIATERTAQILSQLTTGPLRYRLNAEEGNLTRVQLRQLAEHIFQRRPQLLNDSREAPWEIVLLTEGQRLIVELRPRLRPDPRFAYRIHDIPAASHPPLAAAMARLGEAIAGDMVWDPFCGSGIELVERSLRGQVRGLFGTDLNGNAVVIARTNLRAAKVEPPQLKLLCADFRRAQQVMNWPTESLSLIITNPPLGKRVPIADLREMMEELLRLSSMLLQPGGRLVLINPCPNLRKPVNLQRQFHQQVDLGGFSAMLEKYVKAQR
jgi:23S rRNA G2445 N2-methylase RlmL